MVSVNCVYQQRDEDRKDGARRRGPMPFRAVGHSLSGDDSLGDQEPDIVNPDGAMRTSEVLDTERSYAAIRASVRRSGYF